MVPRGNTEKPQFTPTVNCNPKLTRSKMNIDSLLRFFMLILFWPKINLFRAYPNEAPGYKLVQSVASAM